MDTVLKKVTDFLLKYKYAVLVLVIGLILVMLPTGQQTQEGTEVVQADTVEKVDISEELTQILGQIEGVGNVRVMVTVSAGEQNIYQYDEDIGAGENPSVKHDTVIITDSDRNESALIQQVIPAQYRGAIIVCQGADSATVRLNIIEAVSKVTGLGTDKITVLKMK